MMRRIVGLAMVPMLLVGCERKAAEQGSVADSTAAAPPPAVMAPTDTGTKAPAATPTKTGSKTAIKAANSTQPAYDSAFGPSFTVDSTGKVTPIGKKKP